jgi:hypothetical protein
MSTVKPHESYLEMQQHVDQFDQMRLELIQFGILTKENPKPVTCLIGYSGHCST